MGETATTPYDETTERIIGAAIAVHRALGPGLLESAYQVCLAAEFRALRLRHEREVPITLVYRDERLDCAYRIDFVVESAIAVEVKAIERVLPVHQAQLLSYLRVTGLPIGLLINFHVPLLRDGISRRVLGSSLGVSSVNSASPRSIASSNS